MSNILKYEDIVNKKVKEKKKCPLCKHKAHVDFFPFCSLRCKEVDLGNWVSGQYYIADESLTEEEHPVTYDKDHTTLV